MRSLRGLLAVEKRTMTSLLYCHCITVNYTMSLYTLIHPCYEHCFCPYEISVLVHAHDCKVIGNVRGRRES